MAVRFDSISGPFRSAANARRASVAMDIVPVQVTGGIAARASSVFAVAAGFSRREE